MKIIIGTALFFFLSLSIALLFIKILAYKKSTASEKMWNENGACYAITYLPNYKPFGGVGRVLRLFSNQSFFVAYDKSGEKLKSSAWYFWEYQFSDLVEPEWKGINFIYPTDSGLSGWNISECKKIKP